MISSIEIRNFRGIREGKLAELTPLTILVGRNGCGKSTVLDAMLIGASLSPGEAISQTVQRHEGVIEKGRWLFWGGGVKIPDAEIIVYSMKKGTRKTVLTVDHSSIIRGSRAPKIIKVTWPDISEAGKSQNKAAKDPRTGLPARIHPPSEMRVEFTEKKPECRFSGPAPVSLRGVPDMRLVEIHCDGLKKPLHELYSETTRTGQREITKSLIADLVPDIRDVEILTEAGKPILYLVYENRAIPVALAGDGVHALVRIALELASCPDGVVLIEEPELHQHPGAMRLTARAILAAVRRNIQVTLTTHSLEFIDLLLSEAGDDDIERFSLYRLELEKGKMISVRTPGRDIAFARSEIEEDLR